MREYEGVMPEEAKVVLTREQIVRRRQVFLLVGIFFSVFVCLSLFLLTFIKQGGFYKKTEATIVYTSVIDVEDTTNKDVYVVKHVTVPVYDYQYHEKEYTVNGTGLVTYASQDAANSAIGKKATIYVCNEHPEQIREKNNLLGWISILFLILAIAGMIAFIYCFISFRKDRKLYQKQTLESAEKIMD